MDGGNGPVKVEWHKTLINIPEGLKFLVDRYRNDRGIISFTAAVKELLETHPAIAQEAMKVYSEMQIPEAEESTRP